MTYSLGTLTIPTLTLTRVISMGPKKAAVLPARRNAKRKASRKSALAITDRAKRYRAQANVKGPKRCAICGTTKGKLDVMHLSGDESDGAVKNLAYGCRKCNALLGHAFKRIGSKVKTRQYNPASKSVPSFEQYAWGVAHHSRGAHDEGGAVIHATPKHKRIEYARRIADIKGARRGEVPF